MQVDFYQLSRDPVERVLAAIAGKVISLGGRLLVVDSAPERLDLLSRGLWSADPASFLAHGRVGEGREDAQPVLLSTGCEAHNGARHVALADGLWREEALSFERAFYFFDTGTIEGARAIWRVLSRQEGVEPRFWRQDGRKWVQGP